LGKKFQTFRTIWNKCKFFKPKNALTLSEDNFFPLHDNYLLQGKSPEKIFGSIFEYKSFYDKEEVKEIKVRGKFLKKYDENDENTGEKSQARGTKASKAGLSMMSEKRPFGDEFKLD